MLEDAQLRPGDLQIPRDGIITTAFALQRDGLLRRTNSIIAGQHIAFAITARIAVAQGCIVSAPDPDQ